MTLFKRVTLAFSSIFDKEMPKGKIINNRYIVEEFLGMGSYGCSYLVFDQKLQKRVVLKLLRFHKRITKKGRMNHRYEVELLKSINHSSFPSFIDEGIWEKTPFYTMTFINGKTFEQLIFHEGKKYTEEQAKMYALELLERIEYFHKKGIVHRDLRIPNIMLEGDELKVIDFGLAKRMTDAKNKKRNLRKEVSPESDFFQLGHFLLFLLYSDYEPIGEEKEKSWEEELSISQQTKDLIRRLLQIHSPFETTEEIREILSKKED